MTRTEKKQKLANAFKEYRGAYHAGSGKWIRRPNPAASVRIVTWLTRLAPDKVAENCLFVDSVQDWDQFHKWLEAL